MFWFILGAVFLAAAAVFLAPVPKLPNAKKQGTPDLPITKEGDELGVVYGTVWIKAPQIVWYGDFSQKARKKSTTSKGFLGFGKKTTTQIVGYKYYMGVHAILCQSGVDALLEIKFDDKLAWSGRVMDKVINIRKSSLFGGPDKEGGISGAINVQGGGSTQTADTYLANQLRRQEGGSTLVPAFRGVVGLVWRGVYIGTSSRPKRWKAKVQNIRSTFNNWRPDLAPVNTIAFTKGGYSLIIALDVSGSMADSLGGTAKINIAKSAIDSFLAELPTNTPDPVNIRFVKWASGSTATDYFNVDAAKITALRAEVAATGTGGGTNFAEAFSGAEAFWNGEPTGQTVVRESKTAASSFSFSTLQIFRALLERLGISGNSALNDDQDRVMFFITDGAPSPSSSLNAAIAIRDGITPAPNVRGINIGGVGESATAQIDSDGEAVVVTAENSTNALKAAFNSAFSSEGDINPVHILRDALVNPAVNGNNDESSIGDSFAVAATTLQGEGFGLSMFWDSPSDRESFKTAIEGHIDAKTYFDTTTGKWEVKLIRPDFVEGDLFVFDRSNISNWVTAPATPSIYELTNQITLEYTRRDTGNTSSVTITNTASVAAIGRVIPEKISMEGITVDVLANKVAQREMISRGSPVTRGTFRAATAPATLRIGDAIIINEPRLELNNHIARVLEIEEPDGRDNSILVNWQSDVYSLDPVDVPIGVLEEATTSVEQVAPISARTTVVQEMSYYDLWGFLGQLRIDAELTADPDTGYWGAAAASPADEHLSVKLTQLDPLDGQYTFLTDTEFMPSFTLLTELSASGDVATFRTAPGPDILEINIGELIYIDDEILRVIDIAVIDADDQIEWTVGRGCLDTSPAFHPQGSDFVDYKAYITGDNVQYTAADTVTVKQLTSTLLREQYVEEATAETITFASRAARPYPPGKLQIDGSYAAPAAPLSGSVTFTWVDRNRLTQLEAIVEDHTATGITGEASVTYLAEVRYYGFQTDVFDPTDVFAQSDMFTDFTTSRLYTPVLGSPAALTVDVILGPIDVFDLTDVFDPLDVFEYDAAGTTSLVGFRVTSQRDGYDSWQSPEIFANVVQAPIGLTASSVFDPFVV